MDHTVSARFDERRTAHARALIGAVWLQLRESLSSRKRARWDGALRSFEAALIKLESYCGFGLGTCLNLGDAPLDADARRVVRRVWWIGASTALEASRRERAVQNRARAAIFRRLAARITRLARAMIAILPSTSMPLKFFLPGLDSRPA